MRNIATENYVIEFDSGYKSLRNIINEGNYTKIFLLVDENTEKHCLNTFIEKTKLKPHLKKIEDIIIKLLIARSFVNLDDNIRNEVLLNHISFWLNWDNTTLINRIKRSKKRPIAFNSTENEIKKLISERSKIYSIANYKINCEKFSKNEIVKKILDIYEKN